MPQAKKEVFSVVKAVKSNARDRVGTPPPQTILPDNKTRDERRASKHRVTLQALLQPEEKR